MAAPGDLPADRPDEPLMDAAAVIAALQSDAMEEDPFGVLEAAQQRFEEIRPRLIEFLREATAAVRGGGEPEHAAHQYAIYLLAQFRAKEALPAYLEMLSLSDDETELLFAEGITEDTARILAVLADDRLELIDAAIRDPRLDFYVRWQFAQTYVQLVRDGKLTREGAAAKLAEHIRWAFEVDEDAVAFLSSVLMILVVPDTLPLIEQAYEQGLAGEMMGTIEGVRRDFSDPDETFAEWNEGALPSFRDAVEEVRRWPNHSPDDDDDDFDDEFGEVFGDEGLLDEEFGLDDAGELADVQVDFDDGEPTTTIRNLVPRVGRNEPCPCGTGKKYKKCCGKAGD